MKTPVIKTRLTTSNDQSVDVEPYISSTSISNDQKVLCMKTMIMRGLSENRIADSNIPTILNNIPDNIYLEVIKNSYKTDNIKILANAISAMSGMYGIENIKVFLMMNIIKNALK